MKTSGLRREIELQSVDSYTNHCHIFCLSLRSLRLSDHQLVNLFEFKNYGLEAQHTNNIAITMDESVPYYTTTTTNDKNHQIYLPHEDRPHLIIWCPASVRIQYSVQIWVWVLVCVLHSYSVIDSESSLYLLENFSRELYV